MGAGSAALIWYACCCSFVAFTGIIASGLVIYGRKRGELRARSLPVRSDADAATPPSDEPPRNEPSDG